jgi:hypothetical protein
MLDTNALTVYILSVTTFILTATVSHTIPRQVDVIGNCHKATMSGFISPTRDEYTRSFTRCVEQAYPEKMQ